MKQSYNFSPNQNFKQQSIFNYIKKPINRMNNSTIQNDYKQIQQDIQQDEQISSPILQNLNELHYENKNKDKSVEFGQSQQIRTNVFGNLNFHNKSTLPNNKSIISQLMQQQKGHLNIFEKRQQMNHEEDDVVETQDKRPFNISSLRNGNLSKSGSVEDIDEDSIEFIDQCDGQDIKIHQFKGGNPINQIVHNSAIINNSNNNKGALQQKFLHNQIFRQKSFSQDNGFNSQQDPFNFNSNSQQKSSQEIIQDLELKKMREKSAFERQQKLKVDLQDYDDIKLNTNRPQWEPILQTRQKSSNLDDILNRHRNKESFNNEKKLQTGIIEDILQKHRLKNEPSHIEKEQKISQTQQISNLFNTLNKNNLFVNNSSQNNDTSTKNKEILDKFKQKKQLSSQFDNFNNEIQEEDLSNDDSSDENNGFKKQKTNDGGSYYRSQLPTMQQYFNKVNLNVAKQQKIKQKEEERRQRVKQELLEQAKQERDKKLEEESKQQRQKLAQYKKMQELKNEKIKQIQDLKQRNSIKEQLKGLNFEENFAKASNLQAKKLLLSLNDTTKSQSNDDKNQITTNTEDQNQNGQTIVEGDMAAYDKDLDFLFDETETEEEKKNYSSLLRFIFSQDYNKEDIVRVENKRIPNSFSSWKEYFTIFEYLFLMECISNIQQQFVSFKQNENYRTPYNTFIKLITNKENAQGFFEFQVYRDGFEKNETMAKFKTEDGEYNSTEDDYYSLSTLKNHAVLITNEPNLDLTQLSSTNFRKKTSFLFFGWVVPPENSNAGVLKIHADIDAQSFRRQFQSLDQKISVKVYNFQKMTTFIREYLSIKNMRYNELNRFVYNPSHIIETRTPISNPQSMLPLFDELQQKYNESQFQSIKEICLTGQGICMLQGPPGTGKTHTLLGLLSGLYYYIKKNPDVTKPKIMICAPSNTAVDEIVTRIIEIGLHKPGGEKTHVNVIRVGAIDYVPSENVKRACLEYQVEKKMKEKGIDSNKKVDEKDTLIDMYIEVAKINQEIDKSKKELSGQELNMELDSLFEKKRRLQSKISILKVEKVARRDQIKSISDQILGIADVVCCTLASSISEKLERFKNQVEVLIVDEAAQCTEPNNIIPLFYQPNKMVLIGDPKQLPATTFQPDSNVTKYNRSLFERIIDNNIKPYFLDQQYRMHPLIREFPSNQFYDGKLKDGPLVVNRPFPNYLKQIENCNTQFIDIIFSRERMNNKSYENEVEGLASIHICNSIIDEVERLKRVYPEKQENPSIGIITPYKQQTKLISELVRKNIPKYFHKLIQVNTVDSFQGQEKDIIIFTTVRVNSKDQWRENMIGFLQDERRMNVALTRARFCLIVLGHSDTLNSNPIWGAFVDFMAKNNKYGKLRNKDALSDIGKFVLKGSLLEGSSANYAKKDWGEEYKAMLLKGNQVNELKLTDFEAVDEAEQNNETSPNKLEIQGNEGQDMLNEDQKLDSETVKSSGEKNSDQNLEKSDSKENKMVEVQEENDNMNQQRTGISLQEALERQEEKKFMKKIRGSLGGLNGLIDHPKDKTTSVIKTQSDSDQLHVIEPIQREDDAQSRLMKKIFAEKKSNEYYDDNNNQDIYEVMKQQKRENIQKQKQEKMMAEKKSSSLSIIEAAANAANSIKQKTSNNDNSALQGLSTISKQSSSNSNKQGFSQLSTITETTKVQSKSLIGCFSGLVSQEPPPSQFNFQNNNSGVSNNISGMSIYDQINQQRQQNQLVKKKSENKSSNNQNPKTINPGYMSQQQPSSNQYSTSTSSQNKNSYNNEQNTYNTKRPHPQSTSSINNQYQKDNNYDNKQSKHFQNKPQQANVDQYQNSLSLLNEYTNNRLNSSQNNKPLSDIIKTQPTSYKQTSQSDNNRYEDKYRNSNHLSNANNEKLNIKSSAFNLLNNIYMKKN